MVLNLLDTAAARMQQEKLYRARNMRTGGFLGIETKFYDTSLSASNISAPTDATAGEQDPSTILCLSAPAAGDGESNRDGRQICMKYLSVKGVIKRGEISGATNYLPATFFIAIVLDTQTNGAQLNSEDVFTNPAATNDTACSVFRNLQYIKRFQVLKQKTIHLKNMSAVHNGTNVLTCIQEVLFKINVKLPNIIVNFTNTTEGVLFFV